MEGHKCPYIKLGRQDVEEVVYGSLTEWIVARPKMEGKVESFVWMGDHAEVRTEKGVWRMPGVLPEKRSRRDRVLFALLDEDGNLVSEHGLERHPGALLFPPVSAKRKVSAKKMVDGGKVEPGRKTPKSMP